MNENTKNKDKSKEKKIFCIICNVAGEKLILNDLPMRKCPQCGLIWRETFDVPVAHYQFSEIDLSARKIQARLQNCKDRITTASRYIDMNNVCDIGCGEGIFLKALQELGYQNAMGIEPNARVEDFKNENKLAIYQGTIENVCELTKGKGIRTFTMFHLIEHLSDPKGTLTRLKDCMEWGDHLMIETPDIDSYIFKISHYKNSLVYAEHLFYFNRSSLKKLLTQCGFEIVGNGKRGFNQKNMSIKNSLERLGVLPYQSSAEHSERQQSTRAETISLINAKGLRTSLSGMARNVLGFLVTLLRRTDYQWIIVKKM